MKPIIPIIIAMIFDYAVHALLVGAAISVVLPRINRKFKLPLILSTLIVVFAILDNYWIPAVIPLDLKIIIGNDEIVQLFDLPKEMPITDIFDIGTFDFFVWTAQSFLSLYVCKRIIGEEKIFAS